MVVYRAVYQISYIHVDGLKVFHAHHPPARQNHILSSEVGCHTYIRTSGYQVLVITYSTIPVPVCIYTVIRDPPMLQTYDRNIPVVPLQQ